MTSAAARCALQRFWPSIISSFQLNLIAIHAKIALDLNPKRDAVFLRIARQHQQNLIHQRLDADRPKSGFPARQAEH